MEPMLILLAVMVIAMFWMSKKQRKTQKDALAFLDTLAPGARVMTASGYIGTVVEVIGEHVTLESVAGGGTTLWVKGAIRKQVDEAEAGVESAPLSSEDELAAEEFVVPDYVSKLIDKPENDSPNK